MPILALDQFGKIIETSPDREDGLGYGRSPSCVMEGDVTLGNAYLNAQRLRSAQIMKMKQAQALQDKRDQEKAAMLKKKADEEKRQREAQEKLMRSPLIKNQLVKNALAQKCTCDYKGPMGGNVMTANGMSGWAGMNRDQQTLHHVLSGMGQNVAHALDPVEARQAQMREMANKIIHARTRK